ncbi:MAG: RNase adapter RapZ [Syntrophobacterales bacterium]|nr:RNase adapter RapZ [Syntrophobacterales bacterium]
MKIVILSGISGSGKTTFLRALEDIGYFCVDHFPSILLTEFLTLAEKAGNKIEKCALVVDIREKEFFEEGKEILKQVKTKWSAEVVFLDSSNDAIINRFKVTRRSHPLYQTPSIKDAVNEERKLVGWIKDSADRIIDTSYMTPHELRRLAIDTYRQNYQGMMINLLSFGYAQGVPLEADMVFDVRFLPNPYFVNELREKTGLSEDVAEFIRSTSLYEEYSRMFFGFLSYLIPLFEREGKSYLTIGLGCTGGKHRSVFIVRDMAKQFSASGYTVSATHRDIDR